MFLHACTGVCPYVFAVSGVFLHHSLVYLIENKLSLEPGDGCLFIVFANYQILAIPSLLLALNNGVIGMHWYIILISSVFRDLNL